MQLEKLKTEMTPVFTGSEKTGERATERSSGHSNVDSIGSAETDFDPANYGGIVRRPIQKSGGVNPGENDALAHAEQAMQQAGALWSQMHG